MRPTKPLQVQALKNLGSPQRPCKTFRQSRETLGQALAWKAWKAGGSCSLGGRTGPKHLDWDEVWEGLKANWLASEASAAWEGLGGLSQRPLINVLKACVRPPPPPRRQGA